VKEQEKRPFLCLGSVSFREIEKISGCDLEGNPAGVNGGMVFPLRHRDLSGAGTPAQQVGKGEEQ
jgi:hypothetical protein